MPEPRREKEIFEQALDIESPEERVTFIRQACGGDAALVGRIEALIRASEAAPEFLPEDSNQSTFASSSGVATESPGSVIGRYKLLEQIGEGGFGVVYMAEQLEPVKRRVALKIIKPGMDSKQVIGRFEAERQALALMDHPNIAKIFDAGTTDGRARHSVRAGVERFDGGAQGTDAPYLSQGRPYFVMELIRGVRITKFCDEQQLDLEARLNLFIEVCSAVQHAHQKGIIHRDLKPTNILVTLHGERSVPKVIDFGIAKATHQPLTDKTVFTHFQQFLGTPAYMSPEQATLSALEVDTRSDIYSLGVLLYELLTGSPPFDAKELLSGGLDEMRRIIREKEPMRPSTRLTQQSRAPKSPIVNRKSQIASDLDWIILKALEKDPARRYATVNGLAADLKRHLNHEPITAVAPTLVYLLTKLYQRNRRFALLTGAFGIMLLLATVFSTWQSVRARRAEANAKVEAQTAGSVSEFLWKGLIKQLSPWAQTNREISLREALDVAAGQIEDRLREQPLAEASVRLAFGKAYLSLSELGLAETNLLRAVNLRRAQLGKSDIRTAETYFELAILREFQGQFSEEERLLDEVVRIRSRVLGEHHEDTLTPKARVLFRRSARMPPKVAKQALEQMLAELRLHLGPTSDIGRTTMNRLGMACFDLGEWNRALELFNETHRQASATVGKEAAGALWSRGLAAATLARMGRYAEAEAEFNEIFSIQERVNGLEHVLTRDTRLAYVGHVLFPQGQFERAGRILLEVAKQEEAQLKYLRPWTLSALQRLEIAWLEQGGGPAFETFLAGMEIYQNRLKPPEAASQVPPN